ncbi:MAG: isochorismatase family protein [Firmicutes bacterium]|nr:isochorismatase family protein [Bacillota bacterium]
MALWDELVQGRDQEVIRASGYGNRRGLGSNPAVLIIDAQNKFLGTRADILTSMKTYPASLGEEGWAAVPALQKVVRAARDAGVPVIHTAHGGPGAAASAFRRKRKTPDVADPSISQEEADAIVAPLAPLPGELVLLKPHASIFFGTPLMGILNTLRVDTVIIGGFTTSGCVRASVVDAAANNFNVAVVQDGCADRLTVSQKVSLMDMGMKYGDLMTSEEIECYLLGLKG